MAEETTTDTQVDTTNSTSNTTSTNNSSEDTEENEEEKEEEKQKEEDEEDVEEWTPHKGKIMQIVPYKYINNLSWDKNYTDPTGTGNVTLPYSSAKDDSENYNGYCFSPNDLKYIYQGVSCKLKLRRSCDDEFEATGIEETGLSDDEIFEREHVPTEEQREEIEQDLFEAENQAKEEAEKNGETYEKEEDIRYSRCSYDDGIYGFISEVSYDDDGAELEIKDYGYLLERDDIKLEFNELHSVIFEETIKSYGLIPDVDFTGLPDEVLNWTNVSSSGDSDDSSGSLNADGSMTEDQVWQIQNTFTYGGIGTGHDPEKAWSLIGTKEGSSADCYDCTAWLYYCYNFKVGIPARDICYSSKYASSGSHHTIQVQKNGEWIDPPQYDNGCSTLGVISGHQTHVCREPPTNGNIPEYVSCPYSSNG